METSDLLAEPKRKVAIGQRVAKVVGKFRSYKIRMYPTLEQRLVLKGWYAASNRSYNSAIALLRNSGCKQQWTTIRNAIVPKMSIPTTDAWLMDVPVKVRARAVKQAVDAFNTGLSVHGAGKYRMQFRSFRKDPTGTIILEKAFGASKGPLHSFHSLDGWSCSSQKRLACMKMAPMFSKTNVDASIKIRDRHWLVDKLLLDNQLMEDGKILWDKRVNRYWLTVLIDTPIKPKLPDLQAKVVSLDPGVRAFNTYYSPDGTYGELLVDALKVMRGMYTTTDKIKSTINSQRSKRKSDQSEGFSVLSHVVQHRRIQHMNGRMRKIAHRMRCWRTNAHYDAANFLLEQYDWVMLPEFQTQKMAKKENRVIGKGTTRDMYAWSHFTFRQRLLSKAEMDENKWVRIVGEPGTSKTCGNCGWWHSGLGGKKIFQCGECSIELDRDVNGARNNLLALFH